MAKSGKGGLDGICDTEMGPTGSWEVIEGQQGVGILGETVGPALGYLSWYFSLKSAIAFSASAREGAIQISCRSPHAFDCTDLGR